MKNELNYYDVRIERIYKEDGSHKEISVSDITMHLKAKSIEEAIMLAWKMVVVSPEDYEVTNVGKAIRVNDAYDHMLF